MHSPPDRDIGIPLLEVKCCDEHKTVDKCFCTWVKNVSKFYSTWNPGDSKYAGDTLAPHNINPRIDGVQNEIFQPARIL